MQALSPDVGLSLRRQVQEKAIKSKLGRVGSNKGLKVVRLYLRMRVAGDLAEERFDDLAKNAVTCDGEMFLRCDTTVA